MTRYRLSHAAHQDLTDIWLHIASDKITGADRFIEALVRRFVLLASSPNSGRRRPELAAALRSYAVGQYVIFYRVLSDGIEIVRVLSGHRDLPDIFDTPD